MKNIYYSTGKRKRSVAKIWIMFGGNFNNNIIINNMYAKKYFKRVKLSGNIIKPISYVKNIENYNIIAIVKGGGLSSQSDAIKYGLAKALLKKHNNLRFEYKKDGYLRRDSRKVERKKFGLSGARKKFQYSKR